MPADFRQETVSFQLISSAGEKSLLEEVVGDDSERQLGGAVGVVLLLLEIVQTTFGS